MQHSFFNALGGVFSLLLVAGLGYFLARKGWFPHSTRKMIPKFITSVSLPPFMACTVISQLKRDNLFEMAYGIAVPFLLICLLFALAWIAAKIIKVGRQHLGIFCVSVSNSNTIYIGIPVNMALFGPEAVQYVLLFYFPSTIFFWTAGNYFLLRDGGEKSGRFNWQAIISPPMLGFLCGVVIVLANISVPDFIFRAAMLVGELTTPLALLFIGMMLETTGIFHFNLTLDMMAAISGRMIISPLLMWLIVPLFNLPELMGRVFIMQSSLPVLIQVAVLSAYYNTDAEFSAQVVALSTVLSIITIPVYMMLL